MEFKHKSVLLEETVNGLNIKPDGDVYKRQLFHISEWNAFHQPLL